MIAQLKRLALDPCKPQFARDNIQPLWNQILRLRKVMVLEDSEIPWTENTTPNEAPPVDISNAIHYPNSPKLCGTHTRRPHRSIRLPYFISHHIQRKVIPVGPRFQAGVRELTGPVNRSMYNSDTYNSKWLEFRVWPVGTRNMKTTSRTIGKGRHGSCSCVGSADCIRRHIRENKLLLRCDIGTPFFSWKFDEMGERVSSSWTLNEQQTFDSLMKTRPLFNGTTFLKCFPTKDTKDIVNYYFSVYILKRMSIYRSLPYLKRVNTDDEDEDEDEDSDNMGPQKRYEERIISNRKDVKARFLRS